MRTRKIQGPGGMALRIELRSTRGRWYLMLVAGGALTLAFFPWRWAFGNVSDGWRLAPIVGWAAIFTVLCIAAAFGRNIIQLEPDRHIRKGLVFFGIPVWIGRVPVSKISDLQLDGSDADNPVLKCLGPAGNPLLAIEGLGNTREVEQVAGLILSLLDEREPAIRDFVRSFEAESSELRGSFRWGIAMGAFLFGGILAFSHPDPGFSSQLVSSILSVIIAASGLRIALPDDHVASRNEDEGTIRGWYRHRFFWICSYVWDLRTNPDPVITVKRLDKRLPWLGVVLVIYGVLVFQITSVQSRAVQARAEREHKELESRENQCEEQRIGAERLREFLDERERRTDRK